jgi:hypothetical protein
MPAIAKRPGIVTFVAVVLIILGSLALLFGFCGVIGEIVMALLPEPAGKPRPEDILGNALAGPRFLAKEVPGFVAVQIVGIIAYFAFGATALFAGIGCLRLSPAARKAAIVATLLFLLYAMASQVYGVIYILPAQVELQKQQQANLPPGMPDMSAVAQIGGAVSLGCGIAFYVTIAALILIGLNTKSAKAAFAGVPVEMPLAEDDDGDSRHGIKPGDPRPKYEGYEEHDE